LLIHEALTIPDVGQTFSFHGFRFEVVRKVSNRLSSLKLSPR
jgi:Mg2+/Co2+ transporter CorB